MLRRAWSLVVLLGSIALAAACSSSGSNASGTGGGADAAAGSGGSNASCKSCLTSSECGSGSLCGQFAGDAYCAPDCSNGQKCGSNHACTTVTSSDGAQVDICIPTTNVCGGSGGSGGAAGGGGSGGAAGSSGAGGSGGQTDVCGTLVGPSVSGCCSSCGSKPCQTNGCYGGWWCNTQTCKCQAPPTNCNPGTGGTTGSGGTSGAGGTGGGGGNGGSVTGISGGTLDTLNFAIVGDTRPPTEDDTAGYPTAVITKIWQDVQNQNPRPAFAISTGDYMFAKPYANQAGPQLDLYLGARAAYSNVLFPAMGNHECTGGVSSNCGPGTTDGLTNNYNVFLSKMLTPLGVNLPYYAVSVGSTNGSWTAKFVFIAANFWNTSQATWLSGALSQKTTYTFVVRHEGTAATQAPGVTPSQQIIAQFPYTMLIVGHTHTFEYFKPEKQVVVGNGGAPLASGVNYGYVIARQRADGSILFSEFDYATNAVNTNFAVKADGTPAP